MLYSVWYVSIAMCFSCVNMSTSFPIVNGIYKWCNSSALDVILKRGYIWVTEGHVTLRDGKEGLTTPFHAEVIICVYGRHTRDIITPGNIGNIPRTRSRLTQLHTDINETLYRGYATIESDTPISLRCMNNTLTYIMVNKTHVTVMLTNNTLDDTGHIHVLKNNYTNMSCTNCTPEEGNSSFRDINACLISCKLIIKGTLSVKIFSWKDGVFKVKIKVHIKTISKTRDSKHHARVYPRGRNHHARVYPRGRRKRRASDFTEGSFNLSTDHVTAQPVATDQQTGVRRTKTADQQNGSRDNPETSRTAMTASLALLGVALVMITVALSIIFKSEEEAEQPERKDEATEKLLIEGGE